MNTLLISQLKEGEIYLCQLSGQKFLMVQEYKETQAGKEIFRTSTGRLFGKYYNPVSGSFMMTDIADYQLSEIAPAPNRVNTNFE